MELPHIGSHCMHRDCHKLEFLTFLCPHCQLEFCQEHFPINLHSCRNAPPEPQTPGPQPQPTSQTPQYECTQEGCNSKSIHRMPCSQCSQHFCLDHRHHEDHSMNARERRKKAREHSLAIKKQFEEAKAEANRQVDERLSKAKKKDSKCKTALKVQLMRLKGKAIGLKKIPLETRAYFYVHSPLNSNRKSLAIFVSKDWSLGRCIDAIAEHLEVPNQSGAKAEQHLRLFVRSDGQLVPGTMDTKLGDLLSEEKLIDGDSLVLEYVLLPPPSSIDNYELYKD